MNEQGLEYFYVNPLTKAVKDLVAKISENGYKRLMCLILNRALT